MWFAFTCFRDARNPQSLANEDVSGLYKPVIAAFIMTWANPAAYIDSMILGNVAAQTPGSAPALLIGAMCATLLWFPALGLGARVPSKPLSTPRFWSYINLGIGIMMVAIALKLALSN
ncbi:arginine exporter protein ArgO [Corynebacterium suicordis]|nr:arginine exporter protein ArgO [Corynebacterium suicordis]